MSGHSLYPEYRDSGVAWLGRLPSHWSALRGSAFLVECKKRNDNLLSENYLSLMANRGVMPYAEKGAVGNKKPEDLTKCKIVEAGDFVINSMNYSIGSYGLSRYSGVCSPVYVVMKHNAEIVDEQFVDLVLSNSAYQNYAQSFGTGILEHRRAIGWDEIKKIVVGIPPLDEQRLIAKWTHKQTARIDILIAKKTKFIDLLKEKRQAVISKAVTKGLDDSVQMKDSKVTWIGQVPKHWLVATLGYVASINSGATPDRSLPEYWNGNIPWIKTGEVNYDRIDAAEEFITESGLANSATKLAAAGAMLMAMYGQGVTRGRVAILGISAAYNQACAAISFGPKMDVHFGRYFFMAAYSYFRDNGNETSQMNLSTGAIRKTKLTIPPLHEQKAVIEYLDVSVAKVDRLIERTARSVELLKEHRSALITAAVTGKVDVREAQ